MMKKSRGKSLFSQCIRKALCGPIVTLWALLVFAFVIPIQLKAQVITADVVGTVTDATGAVVPGAKITITNVGTKAARVVSSGGTGDFTAALLQPGSYTLHAEAAGFKSVTVSAFTIGAGDRTRIPVVLEPGATAETVEVHSDSIPALQTDSATVQDVVSENAVQDLPLNNRNYIGLVQITAGVNQGLSNSVASGSRPDDRRSSSSFSANGQPDTLNNNMIDGLDNNEREQGFTGVRPSVDAISEVHVMTNDYTAEVGRSTGAVVNVMTKAGSNAFHGTVFEYLRNDKFDGRDAFAKTGNKPEYRQNNFGGSLGGPILKDKTFFFAAAEWNRLIQGTTNTSTVPTSSQLSDPTSISGFPAGGTINPVALRFFKLYPAANLPGSVNNYQLAPKQTQYGTTVGVRVDHQFSPRDIFFAHYSWNPVDTTQPGAYPDVKPDWAGGETVEAGGTYFAGPSKAKSQNLHLDYVHIITPNLLVQLRAGYTGIKIDTLPTNYGKNLSDKIGVLNGNLGDKQSSGLTTIMFTDGSSMLSSGFYIPILDHNNTFQYNGVVTWTRGPQTVKVGGSLIRRQLNYWQGQGAPQGYFYAANWAQFLQGNTLFTGRGNLLYTQGFRSWEPSAFLQDDWRVNSWLTLNLGVRYEVFTPFNEAHNRYSGFDLKTLKVKLASDSGYNKLGVDGDYVDFSPRFGFAASLGHGMVVRGGYGISYYPQDIQSQIQNPNPPFSYSCGGYTCESTVFPILPKPPTESEVNLSDPIGNLTYKSTDFRPGYFHQMNLVMQKEWAGNVLSVGYVGSIGRRLLYQDDINRPKPSLSERDTMPARIYAKQLPHAGQIQRNSNDGKNNYNSLQTSYVRRMRAGLTVNMNYTLAHGLGNSVNPSGTNQNGLWTGNPDYDYGNTAVDIRHRIAFAASYELPFGKSLDGLRGYLAKGWQLNSIAFWQTGSAYGVSNGVNPRINLPGVSTDRPNRYAKASLVPSGVTASCLSSGACFAPQTLGTAGSASQFSEYGPHQRRVDLSLFKNFELPLNSKLQFRAESFNITNTPNFASPSGALGTAGFGKISATSANQSPRQLQLALKLLF
jgi:outer membrane receptor protein involved in Fe transport